jgi:hypothetical protein
MDLEEQSPMDAARAQIAAQPTTWEKAEQKITTGSNALGMAASAAGSGMNTAARIIGQSSGAPALRSFASAAKVSTPTIDITKTGPAAPAAGQPAASTATSTGAADRGTTVAVPATGTLPAKKFTLQGNTYVDSAGKPVDPAINQILQAINYGKIQRS